MLITKKQEQNLKKKLDKVERDRYTCRHWKEQYKYIRIIKKHSGETREEKKARLAIEKAANIPVEQLEVRDSKTGKILIGKDGKPIYKPLYKFRFAHVAASKVKWDILFIYGKKGMGKTVELSRFCTELFNKDKTAMIFYLRNTKEEMDALDAQFSMDESWRIIKIGNKLYHKDLTEGRGRGTRPRHVGYCTYLSGGGLNKWKGGNYVNIKAIIWDECNNEIDQFSLDKATLMRLLNFTNSIVRDKNDVKIIMFGNLLRKDDGTVSNPLLRSMRIDQSSKLKIIHIESNNRQNVGTLLYWNSGSAYSGVENCKYMDMFSGIKTEEFMTNMPLASVNNLLSDAEFVSCKPIWAYVFSYKEEVYVLYFGYFYLENKYFHCVRIELYDPELTYSYFLTSDEVAIKNNQKYKIEKIESEEVADKLEDIYDICENGNIWYGSEETINLLRELMLKWTTKYQLSYSDRESW